jgi:type II secretory pathway pseudopilin PulG
MIRRLGSLIVLFAAAAGGLTDDRQEDAKERLAVINARNLTVAAKAYRIKHDKWPEKLADLTKGTKDMPAYIAGGEKALLDPWGEQYKFAMLEDEKGQEQVYVWSERVVGGETKVYGSKPSAKPLAKEWFRLNREAAKLIEGVKDKAGAEKARPKVEAILLEIKRASGELNKLPRRELFDALNTEPGDVGDYHEAYDRLRVRNPDAAAVLGEIPELKRHTARVDTDRAAMARVTARSLKLAATVHRLKTNTWPGMLLDLTKPTNGEPPLIEGAKSLLDPWGRPYQYKIAPDEKGREQAYVWTEWTPGGRTYVYGEKPPEKKK